jgi:hypothetical protein
MVEMVFRGPTKGERAVAAAEAPDSAVARVRQVATTAVVARRRRWDERRVGGVGVEVEVEVVEVEAGSEAESDMAVPPGSGSDGCRLQQERIHSGGGSVRGLKA